MKIKTIDINAKSWFDRVNGNSYFSGWVILNYGLKDEIRLKMPFEYGYGDYYIQRAFEVLKEAGYIQDYPGYRSYTYCKDNNIILRNDIQRGCLKRDVVNFVK
jgi:hypothetical protein